MTKKYYYNKRDFKLILGDSLEEIKKIKKNSIDMIFADPPYFLSGDGISCSGGKMVSVNKGRWDKSKGLFSDLEFYEDYNMFRHKDYAVVINQNFDDFDIGMNIKRIYEIGRAHV